MQEKDMEAVENDLLHQHGLKVVQTYTVGEEMRLVHFSGSCHLGNTAVETVDLRGLDHYLTSVARREISSDIQWALVKTAGSGKESIMVSLGRGTGRKLPSLRDVSVTQRTGPSNVNANSNDPFETAVSNSFQEQGITSITTSSK